MKKSSLIILFIILTLIFALTTTSVCFADDGTEANEFTKEDTIRLIVCYVIFGLSLVVGIPAIRAVNKRKKTGYVSDLCVETEKIANDVKRFYENRSKTRNKKEVVKYSIMVKSIADMALVTYTEKQIAGYYDLYNELLELDSKLSSIQKYINDSDYDAKFIDIVKLSDSIVDRAKLLKNNEDIVERYNK